MRAGRDWAHPFNTKSLMAFSCGSVNTPTLYGGRCTLRKERVVVSEICAIAAAGEGRPGGPVSEQQRLEQAECLVDRDQLLWVKGQRQCQQVGQSRAAPLWHGQPAWAGSAAGKAGGGPIDWSKVDLRMEKKVEVHSGLKPCAFEKFRLF